MSKGYFTVQGEVENLIIIERSKFICNIKGVENETEAKDYIEMLRKRHSLANHSCYAYIADDKGLVQKFSDAGEPQGTAGLPMLEVLKSKNMYKTVAVVTRYFGGIKLGTGGLTRAYGGSVVECLTKANIANMHEGTLCKVSLDYEWYSIFLKVINTEGISVKDTKFDNVVTIEFSIKSDLIDGFMKKINDSFNGKLSVEELGVGYYNFK